MAHNHFKQKLDTALKKNIPSLRNPLNWFLLVCLAATLSCAKKAPELYTNYKTSMIRFLGSDENTIRKQENIEPTIRVPLKVGFAFAPSYDYGQGFPEKERMNLMEDIAAKFREYKFVESIELIPSLYLEEGGGFSNLDKLRNLFGIDVIMLLSYDQSQFKDTGALSITYWTIVGYYFVEGEKNDTHTLMDAALFHIPSRKMLF